MFSSVFIPFLSHIHGFKYFYFYTQGFELCSKNHIIICIPRCVNLYVVFKSDEINDLI